MSRNTNLISTAALTLAAGVALSLGGCKKPPPPVQGACCTPEGACSVTVQADCSTQWRANGTCNPNPCPPPPPPPDITLETIAKDMSADARVQFAPDLKVEESNLELGKSIVRLADCFARGNAKELKPLLTRRAQALLDDLEASEDWGKSTKQIEAVRVVLIRDGVDFSGIGAAKVPTAEVPGNLMAKVMEAVAGLPPEQLAAITKAATDAMAGADPAALAADPAKMAEFQTKIADAMKSAGVSEEVMNKLADIGKQVAGAPAEAAPTGASGMGIALAIQDIHGAYLLTWQAEKFGEKWAFTNAPATPEIRPRASLWDNVGNEAFQAMSLASLPAAARFGEPASGGGSPGKDGSGGGGGGGGESPGSPPASDPPANPGNPVPSIPGPTGKHPHG